MSNTPPRIFIYGFPAINGGAFSELHHQIILWTKMGIDIHIVPPVETTGETAMHRQLLEWGVTIHPSNHWWDLEPGDPVLSFAMTSVFDQLPEIKKRRGRLVFLSCLPFVFDEEKQHTEQGMIDIFLYQNEELRQRLMPILQAYNDDPDVQYITFRPYFDFDAFPFIANRSTDLFTAGRISRQLPSKYAANTLDIYEKFISPLPKRGIFMGIDDNCLRKIGARPPGWILTVEDEKAMTQQEFYRMCDIILFPSDTEENMPRVGFEAMASGSVLIVNNHTGWREQIEHGITGWLCDTPSDFIYYASKMAYEPELRLEMARKARCKAEAMAGFETAKKSWQRIFNQLAKH